MFFMFIFLWWFFMDDSERIINFFLYNVFYFILKGDIRCYKYIWIIKKYYGEIIINYKKDYFELWGDFLIVLFIKRIKMGIVKIWLR